MITWKNAVEIWQRSGLLIGLSVLLTASVACFAAYVFIPAPGNETLRQVFLSVGTGALSGGVFAWLTKLAQFTGVIRGELETVIYGREHLTNRVDRVKLWVNATRSLYEPRFPGLVTKLDETALKAVLPTEKQFYLKNVRQVITVKPIPGQAGWVTIGDEFTGVLVTEVGNGKIIRPSYFSYDPKATEKEAIAAMIESQKTRYYKGGDTKLPLGQVVAVDEIASDETLPDGTHQVTYSARLDAGTEYRMANSGSEKQNLRVDNMSAFVAASYVDGMDVEVSYPEDALVVQFHPSGGAKFEDVTPKVSQIFKRAHNLLFSDAGFLLTLQLK